MVYQEADAVTLQMGGYDNSMISRMWNGMDAAILQMDGYDNYGDHAGDV